MQSNTLISTGMGKAKQAIPSNSIMYLTGDGNYSNIIRKGAPKVLVSKTLAVYEEMLPEFIRIHKQCLVNPRFIKQIELAVKKDSFVILTNGQRLKIGKHRVQGFRAQFLTAIQAANA